jgi:membrane associated rhomboid family serine protease
VLTFLVIWFAINLLPAVGAVSMPGVEGTIAWQAHFGGFLAGLLLFPLFDPVAGTHRVNGNGKPQSDPPSH